LPSELSAVPAENAGRATIPESFAPPKAALGNVEQETIQRRLYDQLLAGATM
jgi:hypothetical protein